MKALNSFKNAYFYSFTVVGVFKSFMKTFPSRSTSIAMYIEAPLKFFYDLWRFVYF